jgi:hypothetical protein
VEIEYANIALARDYFRAHPETGVVYINGNFIWKTDVVLGDARLMADILK